MLQIVIPVSFLVTLLQWSGWIDRLDFLLNPLMGLLNLPAEAALPIITGMLINLYAAIAIITVLPFTIEQMTLIAIFNLIAHALIIEGVIQHRSGLSFIKSPLIRIGAAIVTVLVVSEFLGDTSQSLETITAITAQPLILEEIKDWGINLLGILTKILVIIMTIMIVLELLKSLGWIEHLLRFCRPLMRVFGLSKATTTMWLAATVFGLFYGGAVIVEEANERALSKDELERLHIFTGVNHSMVEDPGLFAVLGLPAFWLWIPRLITAILMVHGYRILEYLKNRLLG
jgi:spore maturation protein SpmB